MTAGRTPGWRRYFPFIKPNVPADVDAELEFHLAMRAERNVALGMSPADAQRDAEERFGDVTLVREALVDHDQRVHTTRQRTELVGDFLHDVKLGVRTLRRAPAFTLAAVLTLALGIGANTAIFSVVDAVVLQPLPYAHPDRLVTIGTGSAGEYLGLRDRLHAVTDLAMWTSATDPVDIGGEALRLHGAAVTPNLMHMLGVAPSIGREFAADDARPGGAKVVLISDALRQRAFAGVSDVIGRKISIEGTPFTIVGVMPASFHYPSDDVEYWEPYVVDPTNLGMLWGINGRQMIGRLAPGTTLEQARREVRDVWPSLRRSNPLWDPGPTYGQQTNVTALQTKLVGSTRALLWMLFGATLLVLLIACVNVTNLQLARAIAREREFAVRAALGGGRGRLVRQLVAESLVLAGVGAILGVVLAWLAMRGLVAAIPAGMPRAAEISMSPGVLAFALLAAIATGLLFGVVPALRATRAGGVAADVAGAARRATAGGANVRISGALVAGEVALAVLLATASLLLVRSFGALRSIAPGFETAHIVAARVSVPDARFAGQPGGVAAFYDEILNRAKALPDVRDAALVDHLPLAEPVWGIALRVQGQVEDYTRLMPMIDHMQMVTPDYFATMGIPLGSGRTFDANDRAGAPLVGLVSASVAKHFWPNGTAVGQRVGYPYNSPWITIVGIVPDTKQDSLRDTSRMSLYVPWAQSTGRFNGELWLVARSSGDPAGVGTELRGLVRDVDRTVAVSDVRTMDAVLSQSVTRSRFTMLLVAGFAALALVLGALGIYGVMSYLVGERRREMGIRIALGASRASVMQLVVLRGARLAAIGALVGIGAATFASRWLRQWLYGVSPTDPVTFVAVPLIFLGVAALASFAPALRATRADPASTLRAD